MPDLHFGRIITTGREHFLGKAKLIRRLGDLLKDSQINTNYDDPYEASADRYKKYAKAKKVRDVPITPRFCIPIQGVVAKLP